jgi:hypothetical protein
MARQAVLSSFALASLLLAVQFHGSPGLAGGDGNAGGNSGFNPVGGAALTPIGTANFSATAGSQVVVPVATFADPNLAQALVSGGLSQAAADGVLALLLNQDVNGITPQQGTANLVADLQAAGASPGQARALAEALGALGSSPSLATLAQAVDAFNALVASVDGPALQALAAEISPIRAYLVSVIANVRVVAA